METVYKKDYILINDCGRAALRKAPTAIEAIERYEKDHAGKVRVVQVLEQPYVTGAHFDVWKVDHSVRLVRMGS